ncbi:MAG: NADP-dependent isocitrate dehydrogenase [Hydrotalea flava]|uniref:NADP-dependent isocitrate dehydrogenase n=1 Tax=Hydrotalea TaxID=1004300 RepID=UPI0009431C4C|nr:MULTISPECIES: NADP-dependent isocitrate dehydrogenase [Hydrotalea]NIM35126.1 NADP-dependent isocitrate dehydrogenase [Hydrotalea flava]NIM37952.1 NADP-dependent isocitrate dehydrogenase [Hydrotalea flava]NIN03121.1 NADP-dependent isocitrate dehydrogenase [Hydrotalea flava]NIN14806.1 NADP-dependent isocitrate dehydrogenase [Hydrotalea flava]NIO93878.1 NADP-dependent isocitrate dehydrogenase [Hydrotalea flava]
MTKITVAKGDGIGPEIMDATLEIILAAGAKIDIEEIEVGEKVYLAGNTSGIAKESWDIIRRNKVFLKAPITTPQGGGYKSLNVTTRKFLGLYSNVRPCMSLHPFVRTKHPIMDIVIVRENEEDLYAGIEHQQTDEVVQCLKLISRPGCEKIVRYAFEYAKQYDRKKVTCFTKDNIMKQTDGLFHKVFDEIAKEYPEIENEHWIVDIGAAKMADTPEVFDVIVMPNLYGDILSDVAAQIAGSVGLAGSANIGEKCAMFEAIHGSAPRRAGQNLANPSGLLQGAVMMLNHIGQTEIAEKVQNAWLKTIEDGTHTYDIFKEGFSVQKVGTKEFAQAVIANLGNKPAMLKAVSYAKNSALNLPKYKRKKAAKKELVGVDVFVDWSGTNPDELAKSLHQLETDKVKLSMITNRGIKVWPDGFEETFCTDHWRCRFKPTEGNYMTKKDIIELLANAVTENLDTIKTENLYAFDGKPAFSLGQGQ